MGTKIRRAFVPALLLSIGVTAMLKGMLYHPIPVLVDQETPTTIEVPLMLPGPQMRGMPFGGPATIKKTVMRTDEVTILVPEPELIRDVSVGGVTRLDSGALKRMYSGKGPALCPT